MSTDKSTSKSRRKSLKKRLLERQAARARLAARKPKHMTDTEWAAIPLIRRARIHKALTRAEALERAQYRRALELAQADREITTGPTPETVAKMRDPGDYNPLVRMLQTGDLTREDLNAAYDIACAYHLRTADVRVKLASYETHIDSGGWREQPPDTKRQIRLQRAYLAWCRQVIRAGMVLEAILEVIVHGTSLRRAALRAGRTHKTMKRDIIKALGLYDFNPRPERAAAEGR